MQRIAEEIYDELDSYTQNAVVSHGDYRSRHWQPEYSSTEAYLGSVSPNRERLREILTSPRVKLLMQFNSLPEGVEFLVGMRSDLLRYRQCRRF